MNTKHNLFITLGTILIGSLAGLSFSGTKQASPMHLTGWQESSVHLENSLLRKEVATLKERITTLENQLNWSEESRFQQGREFLLWQEVISSLDPQGLLRNAGVFDGLAVEGVVEPEELPAPDPAQERAEVIAMSVRNLMASEGIYELDLLEVGLLQRNAVGPVVYRMLDDRGRLVGSLSAQSMHFEASATARTVTLILENGYESHGGVRSTFAERRLPFSFVDPWPWVESVPELFPNFDAGQATPSGVDDGKYDLDQLRKNVNRLLLADSANGYFGIKHIDGVKDEQIRGLHIVEYSSKGVASKHMFADRATILMGDRGVSILLEDGASMRGDEKTAFLRGRFRIFLPNARQGDWKAAGLPGLPGVDE